MQQIARAVAMAFNNLSRPHRIMLGSLTAVTLVVGIWRPHVHYHESGNSTVRAVELEKDTLGSMSVLPDDSSEPLDQDTLSPEEDAPADEIDQSIPSESGTHDYVISTGDTLSSVLNQYGIDMTDINQLVKSDPQLRNLQIGQQLSWVLNDDSLLQQLTWNASRRETRTYERIDGGFKMTSEIQKGEWKNAVLQGDVNGSFVNSARQAGLSGNEISAVIKALQWQMDFRKLRKGDHFAVLVSREMLEGRSEQSQLIGVRMHTNGRDYYAIRADDGKFYDRNGSGLARGFLRFPTVKQYRVSSNFNPRRVNPVTGRVTAHKGVDFAVPIGTPVLAVGDGEVIVSKRSGAAGNYVAIRHGRQYMTRYMHLSRLLVKPGQKVKRGERIGLSGNTGRSTGPHLHYEIWINNQVVNPLTAKLPRLEGLAGKSRQAYLENVRQVIPQLRFK